MKNELEEIKNNIVGNCKKCNSTGWIADKQCECLLKLEFYINMKNCGIDSEYWNVSFKEWKGDKVVKDSTLLYINNIDNAYNSGLGIVFYGKNGVGKTMCAMEILKEAIIKKYKVRNIVMGELIKTIQNSFENHDLKDYYENEIKNSEFLCLDNLGPECKPSNFNYFVVNEFDLLARYRRRKLLPTIITSNLEKDKFLEIYGSSINSLLIASCKFISVEGKDFREEQGKNWNKLLTGDK